jgi:hypothetical protein
MRKLLHALALAAAPANGPARASSDDRLRGSGEQDNCFPASSTPADGCYPRAEAAADQCFPGPASAPPRLRRNWPTQA